MSYDPLFSLPTGVNDIESVFKTGRGSTYAHHADMTTTRNRSAANHTDKSTGVQQRSGKTIYMDPANVNRVAGIYQNAEMATKFVPVLVDGKPTGQVALQLMEDYGPKKAGSTIMQAPYSTKPAVGMNPVEIWGSESPTGSSGRNIHFGNAITEVHPRPSRLPAAAGKAGIAASLMGAASAAKAGEYGEAIDKATDIAVLPFAESRMLNENEADELAKRRLLAPTIDKARGGSVRMPDEYSQGSWKLI